jgi:hypothetical protein
VEIRGKFFPYYTPYLLQLFQLHKKELSECWIATAPSGYRHRFTGHRGGAAPKVSKKSSKYCNTCGAKWLVFAQNPLKKLQLLQG